METNTKIYLLKRIPDFNILQFSEPLLILAKWIWIKISLIISIIALSTNFAQDIKWKRIAQLVLSIYAIFSSSALYVMLYFFPFIIMFFNKEKVEKGDWIYLLLIIFMLNPFQIADIYDEVINNDLVKISAIVMLICLTKESFKKLIDIIKEKKQNKKLQNT